MTIKHLTLNENHAVFKLGEDYIVVETNTGNKARDFQNTLIAEELLDKEHTQADMSMHNVKEIIDKFRQTTVLIIE